MANMQGGRVDLRRLLSVKPWIREQKNEDCFTQVVAVLLSWEMQAKARKLDPNSNYEEFEASAQQIADHMWKDFPWACRGYIKGRGNRNDKLCELSKMTFYDSDHYYPMEYVRRHGVCLNKDYPYTGVFQRDHVIPQTDKIRLNNIIEVNNHQEARRAIANGHPVIARMRNPPSFGDFVGKTVYKKHWYERKMKDWGHFVVLIGYVKEGKKDYYTVQNSWGYNWGDKGLAKVAARELDPKIYVEGVYLEKAAASKKRKRNRKTKAAACKKPCV